MNVEQLVDTLDQSSAPMERLHKLSSEIEDTPDTYPNVATDEPVPYIKHPRIDMFDVLAALTCSDPHGQFETWELSEGQRHDAVLYAVTNLNDVIELQNQHTPSKE